MFIKPVQGKRVINPQTMAEIPKEGVEVPKNSFWIRRVKDGDVEEVKKPVEVPKTEGSEPLKEETKPLEETEIKPEPISETKPKTKTEKKDETQK